MNTKGKKSRNEIILDIFLYGGLVCFIIALLLGCVVPFLIRDFLEKHPDFDYNVIFWAFFILAMVFGVIFCVLILFLKVEKTNKPPTIIKSPASNYEETMEWFQRSLTGFSIVQDDISAEKDEWTATVWQQQKGIATDYRVLLRMNEATAERIDAFLETMYTYFEKEKFRGIVAVSDMEVTVTICVNRITPSFKDFLNYNNQRLGFFILVVGISFGSRQLYYVPSIDGFAPLRYKKLLKRFLSMIPVASKKPSAEGLGNDANGSVANKF